MMKQLNIFINIRKKNCFKLSIFFLFVWLHFERTNCHGKQHSKASRILEFLELFENINWFYLFFGLCLHVIRQTQSYTYIDINTIHMSLTPPCCSFLFHFERLECLQLIAIKKKFQ